MELVLEIHKDENGKIVNKIGKINCIYHGKTNDEENLPPIFLPTLEDNFSPDSENIALNRSFNDQSVVSINMPELNRSYNDKNECNTENNTTCENNISFENFEQDFPLNCDSLHKNLIEKQTNNFTDINEMKCHDHTCSLFWDKNIYQNKPRNTYLNYLYFIINFLWKNKERLSWIIILSFFISFEFYDFVWSIVIFCLMSDENKNASIYSSCFYFLYRTITMIFVIITGFYIFQKKSKDGKNDYKIIFLLVFISQMCIEVILILFDKGLAHILKLL